MRVAVVGATGLVGREFLKVLEELDFPVSYIRLLASERSSGRVLNFRGEGIKVEELKSSSFDGIDLALFSAGAGISREFAPIAVRSGAVVVDNSSAWRMDKDVPLVVPEVNPDDLLWHKGIIANPNCSTIQMVVAIYPLHRVGRVKRIIVDTYQSVSGWGAEALTELFEQTRLILDGKEPEPGVLPKVIGFNLFPHIDSFDGDRTKEELKMVNETRKIMHEPELPITATCVRVPIPVSHSEAVHIELERKISPDEAREILSESPGVRLMDEPQNGVYPYPRMAQGRNEVFVGRIRVCEAFENGLSLWVVADNLRKGAALNAVQIAMEMRKRGIL